MEEINHFVFFDLGTTGLPVNGEFKTKITELSMLAVSREHFLSEAGNKNIPRVKNNLTLCFNPEKKLSYESKNGFTNSKLQNERPFDKDTVELINNFLKRLKFPICFVAHNGYQFDYPILNAHILKASSKIIDNIYCVDSISYFKFDNESKNQGYSKFLTPENTPLKHDQGETSAMKRSHEDEFQDDMISKKIKINELRRNCGEIPSCLHKTECDCYILLACCAKSPQEFVAWCDGNKRLLKSIPAMEFGKGIPKFDPKMSHASRKLLFDD